MMKRPTPYQMKLLTRIAAGEHLHIESIYDRGTFRVRVKGMSGLYRERIYERSLTPMIANGWLERRRVEISEHDGWDDLFALTDAGRALVEKRAALIRGT